MPSKGVDVYSYISLPGYIVEFSAPQVIITNTSADNFTHNHLEVESHNIPGKWNFDGRFGFRVLRTDTGAVLANEYNVINTMSGNMTAGNMMMISATKSIITNDVVITYGFYDAGHGEVGLTNHDQCYVTVTPNRSDWMGMVAPPDDSGSTVSDKPFSSFVLPCPHDCGMNNMDSFDALLNGPHAIKVLESVVDEVPGIQQLAHLGTHEIPDIVFGLAICEKDTISSQLAVGARYFEFRPAYMHNDFRQYAPFPDQLYFQHMCIPGMMYEQFLFEVVEFLDAHPTEIVVVRHTWDNIPAACVHPTQEELDRCTNEALAKSTTNIKTGDVSCLSQPISQLRNQCQRLIFLENNVGKYDSWDAKTYATLTPAPLLAKYETMSTEGQESSGAVYTVLQCQATSQSIKEVLAYSVAASNASTSCLMSTKGSMDMVTLPWIRQNALDRLQAPQLIVLLNDFIDGATVDTAIELSQRRLQ